MVRGATVDVVAKQAHVGIDVANDGEQGRESFFTFVRDRISGFGPELGDPRGFRDMIEFPTYVAKKRAQRTADDVVSLGRLPACTGPVTWLGPDAIDAEIARFDAVAASDSFADRFLTSPSPGIVASAMTNRYYPSIADYVAALGEALANEYRRVVEAGLILQIDAPDLGVERHTLFRDAPLEDFLAFGRAVMTAINRAIAGLSSDRVRLHVCWGNYDGPHCFDVPMADIMDVLAMTDAGSLVIALANPRHAHEVRLLADQRLDRYRVVAGVIDTTTNYVEHPEVVADRLVRVVEAVGDPQRVVAGTDCGFATAAGFSDVASEIVWLKLGSLVEGAALASERLGL